MSKILIVEDDKEINVLLDRFLTRSGYETVSAADGIEAIEKFEENGDISLVLLDLMLPYKSGDMVLKEIREKADTPVIAVSAKGMVQTKIDIIKAGADDYVTKPFDLDELQVRIEAVLRRYMGRCGGDEGGVPSTMLLRHRNLTLNQKLAEVLVKGNRIELTAKEYKILLLLLKNPTKLFSKANLFESVWGEDYVTDEGAVKVHISNLRNKIRKYDDTAEYIDTVWGMGYRLTKENDKEN